MRISDWSSDVCSSDLVLHRGVIRIEEDAELGGVEILRILDRRSFLDPVGIVEHDAQVANAADAGFGTDGRLAGLYARVRSEEHTSELQSLLRISYAVFCLHTTNYETDAQILQRHEEHTSYNTSQL